MSIENSNKIVGGIFIIGIVVIIFCLVGALNAIDRRQHLAAGIFMLAASLPVAAAFHGIFKK